jgi:hypothetical protein
VPVRQQLAHLSVTAGSSRGPEMGRVLVRAFGLSSAARWGDRGERQIRYPRCSADTTRALRSPVVDTSAADDGLCPCGSTGQVLLQAAGNNARPTVHDVLGQVLGNLVVDNRQCAIMRLFCKSFQWSG